MRSLFFGRVTALGVLWRFALLFLFPCLHLSLTYTCTHSEWLVNQHRDSFVSFIGHPNLLEFFAVAENESKSRVKFNFLQVAGIDLVMSHV